jgi:RNA polymerase sigma-70 factor (sigma-E family)
MAGEEEDPPVRMQVVAAVDGRASRIEDLYVHHVPAMRTTAFLILGDRMQAEDVTQEAFVRVLLRFRHLRPPAAFEAYLRKTVVNLCMSALRHRKVERAYVERQRSTGPAVEGLPDVGLQDQLWRALQQLPPRRRAAIVLRYYEDLSEQQVADILGCSVPAVRSLVFKGMEPLRSLIRSEER